MKGRILGVIMALLLSLTAFSGTGSFWHQVNGDDRIPVRAAQTAEIEHSGKMLTFTTLSEALAAVRDDVTIVMLADTSEDNLPYRGGSFTLDLNGRTVTTKGFTLRGTTAMTLTDSAETKGKLHLMTAGDR